MKIDRNLIIGGLPIKALREIMKDLGRRSGFDVDTVSAILRKRLWHDHVDELVRSGTVREDSRAFWKQNGESFNRPGRREYKAMPDQTAAATALIEGLLAEGFIERSADGSSFSSTMKGNAFANSSLLPRISRAKADVLLKGVLERAAEINARGDLLDWITEIRVFGSYNTDTDDLGDIDLAIDIKRRLPGEDYVKASLRMAEASGKSFSNYIDELCYAERLIRQLLKKRSPYISVHDARGLSDEPQFRGKTIYTFEPPAVTTDVEPVQPGP
jgi:predicted nucleotidyltransferase